MLKLEIFNIPAIGIFKPIFRLEAPIGLIGSEGLQASPLKP